MPGRTDTRSPATSESAAPRAHPVLLLTGAFEPIDQVKATRPGATACWPSRSSRRSSSRSSTSCSPARVADRRRRHAPRGLAVPVALRTPESPRPPGGEADAAVTSRSLVDYFESSTPPSRSCRARGRTRPRRSMSSRPNAGRSFRRRRRRVLTGAKTSCGAGGGVRGAARRRAEHAAVQPAGIAVLPRDYRRTGRARRPACPREALDRVVRETVADLVSTIAERLVRDDRANQGEEVTPSLTSGVSII